MMRSTIRGTTILTVLGHGRLQCTRPGARTELQRHVGAGFRPRASRRRPLTDQVPQVGAATWTMAQHGDTIVADRETVMAAQAAVKSHVKVVIDGKPWKNMVPQMGGDNIETSSVLSWEGAVLVTRTSGNIQGNEFVQTDRWTMAGDGKSFVSKRVVTVGDPEIQSSTLTFNKKS